jgi:hypothetical protein
MYAYKKHHTRAILQWERFLQSYMIVSLLWPSMAHCGPTVFWKEQTLSWREEKKREICMHSACKLWPLQTAAGRRRTNREVCKRFTMTCHCQLRRTTYLPSKGTNSPTKSPPLTGLSLGSRKSTIRKFVGHAKHRLQSSVHAE